MHRAMRQTTQGQQNGSTYWTTAAGSLTAVVVARALPRTAAESWGEMEATRTFAFAARTVLLPLPAKLVDGKEGEAAAGKGKRAEVPSPSEHGEKRGLIWGLN